MELLTCECFTWNEWGGGGGGAAALVSLAVLCIRIVQDIH